MSYRRKISKKYLSPDPPNTEIDKWFATKTKQELRDLFVSYSDLFDVYELGEYLGVNKQKIMSIMYNEQAGVHGVSYENYERICNYVMYVPPMNEPNEIEGYKIAIAILSRYVKMKSLCEYYGFSYKDYDNFMNGDMKAISLNTAQLLYKALRLRPLAKFGKPIKKKVEPTSKPYIKRLTSGKKEQQKKEKVKQSKKK